MESIGVLWNHDQTEDQFLLPLCHRRNHRQDGRSRPPRPYLYAQQNRGRLHNLTPRTATHQQRQQAEAQNRRSYSGTDASGQQRSGDAMSTIDDVRKLLQDFIAPELAAIKEKIDGEGKVSDARYQAAQSQYAALQTNMELIKQHVKIVDTKLDTILNRLDAKEVTA
jgi:hypothetical protein